MLWDGLILLLIATLCVTGWNVGIINSWRGPIALLFATIITQQFYIDFCTWIVQQLRVPPEHAVPIGYLLLWGAIDIVLELVMNLLLPWGSKRKPLFFERAGGAVFGLLRALIVILLPMVALLGPLKKIPTPPADKAPLINPMQSGIDKSPGLAMFYNMAKGLYPALKPMVISEKEPSFKPNFSGSTALDEQPK